MGGFRRFLRRLTESDETRLETEIREWADRVPGSVRIADAPMRQRVKIAGAFAEEPHVDVVVVPYHLGADRAPAPSAELVATG